jgi:hypothetical protein
LSHRFLGGSLKLDGGGPEGVALNEEVVEKVAAGRSCEMREGVRKDVDSGLLDVASLERGLTDAIVGGQWLRCNMVDL